MTFHCAECTGLFDALFDDPRTPPLDDCPCLCADCAEAAWAEAEEAAERDLQRVRDRRREAEARIRRHRQCVE